MRINKEEIKEMLAAARIEVEAVEHPAVYTVEDMMDLELPHAKDIAKNLFLRDDKKKEFYLITMREDKKADLKALRTLLDSRPLRFAEPEELDRLLGLYPGAVTPFGLLNDEQHQVHAYLDQSFRGGLVGVHPNENTATFYLKTEALYKFLQKQGAQIKYIKL